MNLENKLFFRVIKVAYILSFPVFILLLLCFSYQGWSDYVTTGKQPGEYLDWIVQNEQLYTLLLLCIFTFPIYFSIVNLTKETLIYIAFGRKFVMNWIEKIGHFTALIMISLFVATLFINTNTENVRSTNKTSIKASGKYFHIGQKVHHKIFGNGTVIDRKGKGEDLILQVRFEKIEIGTKYLIASYVEAA